MKKVWAAAKVQVARAARKFTHVTVSRGGTAYPKAPKELQNLGVRWDYDGEVEKDGITYNKFQIQPNGGDGIPSAVRDWRDKNGGTHAVMGTMWVKKGGSAEDVTQGLDEFVETFKQERS